MLRSIYCGALVAAVLVMYACSESNDGGSDPADTDSGTNTGDSGNSSPLDSGGESPGNDSGTDAGPSADASDAGPQWVGPDGGVTTAMTYFVTSRGMGNGGNLTGGGADGLAGADAFCKQLANEVSPLLGGKTWRAYLSTTTVNARSRIGSGPWYNAKGVVIADSLEHLHDEAGMNNLTLTTNLDELGNQVPSGGGGANVHDILTGTLANGSASQNHCNNWTSSAGNVTAQVGHSNRQGGGAAPTSWNSAHATRGCAEQGGNSVRSGGGRGSFYCFATN